jgi:hypothetical protein
MQVLRRLDRPAPLEIRARQLLDKITEAEQRR